MNARFHISRQPWRDNVEIFFSYEPSPGVLHRALPVTMWAKKEEDEGKRIEPMMRLDGPTADTAMQSLMDELWREGYRPKDIGTAGHLAATQAHLADFRALVSKTLDIKLP